MSWVVFIVPSEEVLDRSSVTFTLFLSVGDSSLDDPLRRVLPLPLVVLPLCALLGVLFVDAVRRCHSGALAAMPVACSRKIAASFCVSLPLRYVCACLPAVAFHFAVGESIPPVSYVTTLDRFMILVYAFLFASECQPRCAPCISASCEVDPVACCLYASRAFPCGAHAVAHCALAAVSWTARLISALTYRCFCEFVLVFRVPCLCAGECESCSVYLIHDSGDTERAKNIDRACLYWFAGTFLVLSLGIVFWGKREASKGLRRLREQQLAAKLKQA